MFTAAWALESSDEQLFICLVGPTKEVAMCERLVFRDRATPIGARVGDPTEPPLKCVRREPFDRAACAVMVEKDGT